VIMWDKRVGEKVAECVGDYTLAISFRNVADHSTWALTGVYGPNFDRDRRLLWDELAGLHSCWNLPWCIRGDFNVTRFPSERSGAARLSSTMMEFSDFIYDQGLIELPLVGGAFAWSTTHDLHVWSKIDIFLVSPDWEAVFPRRDSFACVRIIFLSFLIVVMF
jgi:hypothetical protein